MICIRVSHGKVVLGWNGDDGNGHGDGVGIRGP